MRKLLRADLVRMRKTKVFWYGMILLAGLSVWMFLDYYFHAVKYEFPVRKGFAESIFESMVFIGILISACSSLFTGTEYDDGTIRNKLMIGQARVRVYLADWLSCLAASIIQAGAAVFAVFVTGFLLAGLPDMEALHFFKVCLVLLFVCTSYLSIFHMISMLVTNKSHSVIANVLLAFVFLIAASMIAQYLNAPEMITEYRMTNNGAGQIVSNIPNPNYVTGTKRAVYQFLNDFLPGGQIMQISVFSSQQKMHTGLLCLYSSIITIGTNIIGMILFQRKDIK